MGDHSTACSYTAFLEKVRCYIDLSRVEFLTLINICLPSTPQAKFSSEHASLLVPLS